MSATWWNRSWTKRIKVGIDNSHQTEALVDFPILVRLDSSRVTYSDIQFGGNDLRFLKEDNATTLDYEVEKWDDSGTSVVWVRVPLVGRSDAKGYVWMYYGNPAAPAGANPTGVWSANHKAVWHMNNSPTGSVVDSTSNANHLTSEGGMITGDLVGGKIGDGIHLDGVDDALSQAALGDGATWTQMTLSTVFQTMTDAVEQNATDIFASWRIDEGETLHTFDTISGSRGLCHHTMIPAVSVVEGVLLKGLLYDGVDDITKIPSSTAPSSGSFSVGLWLNPTSTINSGNANQASLFHFRDAASTNDILVEIQGSGGDRGKIKFSVHRNAAIGNYYRVVSDASTWTAGTWYHIVCTFSTVNGLSMYVDAVLQADTDAGNDRGAVLASRAAIGGNVDDSEFFSGKIDEVKVWSKELSIAEIGDVRNFYLYHGNRVMVLHRGHDGDAFELAIPHRGPVSCGFDRAGVTYLMEKFAWPSTGIKI